MSSDVEGIEWPAVSGDIQVGDPNNPIAVVVIGRGSVNVPKDKFAILGTVKTENLGLERIIANVISNPRIRFLIVCGKEEFGHFPADALLSLHQHGVDERKRIRCKRSAVPFLCNVEAEAIERFRQQVEVVDLVHPKQADEIVALDPIYIFDQEREEELLAAIPPCLERNPGPFPGEPYVVVNRTLAADGKKTGADMHHIADYFIGQMLRMPSEKLSTNASLAVVSQEFQILLDPLDGNVFWAPSVDLASRLRAHFRGES